MGQGLLLKKIKHHNFEVTKQKVGSGVGRNLVHVSQQTPWIGAILDKENRPVTL